MELKETKQPDSRQGLRQMLENIDQAKGKLCRGDVQATLNLVNEAIKNLREWKSGSSTSQ